MKVKKIAMGIVCSLMIVATMGITVLAAGSGRITGNISGSYAYVTFTNTSGGDNYCTVALQESRDYETWITVNANGSVISSGSSISVGGNVSQLYARGLGIVYNSASPSSGVAAEYTTRLR